MVKLKGFRKTPTMFLVGALGPFQFHEQSVNGGHSHLPDGQDRYKGQRRSALARLTIVAIDGATCIVVIRANIILGVFRGGVAIR